MGTGQAYSHQEPLIQMKWAQEEIETSVTSDRQQLCPEGHLTSHRSWQPTFP